ncbi:MAG: ArsR/SmtB family transcription factor [Myxococcaceae bacterium]
MEAVLDAIAEPRRREILRMVLRKQLSSGEIASRFDVTRSAISQHLRILERVGLVSVERAGTRRLYRARPEGLTGLREYLEEFWGDRLATLKAAVETQERKEAPWPRTQDSRSRSRSGSRLHRKRSSRS